MRLRSQQRDAGIAEGGIDMPGSRASRRHSRAPDLQGLERQANEIGRHLDIAILLSEIEPGPPVVIRAVFMRGASSTSVEARGVSKSGALRELADLAAAWAQSNPLSKQSWLAGG